MRRDSLAVATALLILVTARSASALSFSMEFAGGTTELFPTAGDISSTFTVSLFADLTGGGGGGVFFVAGSVNFSSNLTPLRCKEQGGTFNNGVGGVPSWAPLTPGCGGISGQNVLSVEQGVASGTAGGTFGKLKIATITFHINGLGLDPITPFFIVAVDGFLQNDGTTFTSTAPVFGAIVGIPEPATALLLGLGILGLGLSGRRRMSR